MNIEAIIRTARANGGLTVDSPLVGQYAPAVFHTGYMVSAPRGIENLPDAALTPALIEAFLADQPDYLFTFAFLGLWRDAYNNWSVDVSFHVEGESAARVTGREWNQRAIWDFANECEIIL